MGVVVLGAGGKLGQLLQPIYPGAATWLTRADVDVLNSAALTQVLAGADAVICLAGVTNTSTQPMALNTTLARAVLDAAATAQAGRVILFSSAAVYGHTPSPLHEDGPAAPVAPYGFAKLEMEEMATAHPHPNVTIRLGNVAGADAILGNWKPGFTLDTFEDGTTPRRSYIGPNTLARVIHDLTRADTVPDLINVAAPGAVEMGALLDAANLAWETRPATEHTIANVTLDTARLEQVTTFHPQDSTAAGIVADWRAAKAAQ
ncbi:NAD-dependent epimerase/dehydratase family protein [Tateyamaria sp.]|uniref:NAD-dependent epimerase/dehydratase family protein n=1 Tax=Tateyamaria sp. TaxID=1929288 RepID=UPI003B218849